MRLSAILLFFLLGSLDIFAQIPTGYYDVAEGLTGTPLKSALKGIIDDHTSIAYGDVDVYFPVLDKKPNGKVWDVYSYVFGGPQPYEYTFGVHECDANLNYNSEGDCFNKEHIWPQSIYGQQSPMRSDLHQLLPTDGWVNNKRSNYPFGKVTSIIWTSDNGSKLGTSNTYSSYSGNVFEPVDSFKGDIARIMFYMATRYYGEAGSWSSWAMATANDLTPDAIALLLDWHHMDPVSRKEIDRNNGIYNIQSNRNPFVDHPFMVDCIWGSGCTPLAVDDIPDTPYMKVQNGYLVFTDRMMQAQIYLPTGQMISQLSDVQTIDVSELPVGLYILYLMDAKAPTTYKFSIN